MEDDFEITANNEEIAIREEEIGVSQIDESNEFCFEFLSYIPSKSDVACQNIEPSPLSQLTYILKEEINISHEYFANNKYSDVFNDEECAEDIALQINPCNIELNAVIEVGKVISSASREMRGYPNKKRSSIIYFVRRLQKRLRKV